MAPAIGSQDFFYIAQFEQFDKLGHCKANNFYFFFKSGNPDPDVAKSMDFHNSAAIMNVVLTVSF